MSETAKQAADKLTVTPELAAFIREWKNKPGNLIMVLHRVQQTYGYVPREIAFDIAALLDVPLAKIYGVSLDWLCSDASDAGALVQEKNLDERDPVCNSELPTEDKPKKRKKWAIIIGVIIVGVLLSAYVVLSKKAGSFLSTAKQIDDLEEENVENALESGFEFDWQGE